MAPQRVLSTCCGHLRTRSLPRGPINSASRQVSRVQRPFETCLMSSSIFIDCFELKPELDPKPRLNTVASSRHTLRAASPRRLRKTKKSREILEDTRSQHVSTVRVACAPFVSLRHFSQCTQCTAILAFYDLPHVVAVCSLISWKICHRLIKLLMMQSLSAYVLSTTMNGNGDQFACGNLFFFFLPLVYFSLLHAALLSQHWK